MKQIRSNYVSLPTIFFTLSFLSFTPLKAYAINIKKIEKAGDLIQIVIPTIAYGSTFLLDDKEGRNQFYKSLATNFIVTDALKYTINRTRPNGNDHSFPSGHTSAAFQGASFIHKRYGFKYAFPAYLGAIFVGYSRVKASKHYTSDVFAGAIIGTLSSWYFTKEYKNKAVIALNATPGYYGLTMRFSY